MVVTVHVASSRFVSLRPWLLVGLSDHSECQKWSDLSVSLPLSPSFTLGWLYVCDNTGHHHCCDGCSRPRSWQRWRVIKGKRGRQRDIWSWDVLNCLQGRKAVGWLWQFIINKHLFQSLFPFIRLHTFLEHVSGGALETWWIWGQINKARST